MERGKGLICIIDDDEAVRESLRILLFSAGFTSCSFESADTYLAADAPPEAEALLLDIRMPGTDGITLHEILVEQGNLVPVIFITGHGDIPLAVSAIQRGAVDFLTKPFEEDELIDKISNAVNGYRVVRAQRAETEKVRMRLDSLTPRETDVLELLVTGHSNKGIASELDISPRTVEIHRARVMEKTGANSVAELVQLVSASRSDPDMLT